MTQQLSQAIEEFAAAMRRAAFAMLDLRLAMTPLEERPRRSWEVEREDFVRRMERDLNR